jgi:transcriptional regulator with XRE-family HTH domain
MLVSVIMLRNHLHFSSEDVANALGVSVRTMKRWLHDKYHTCITSMSFEELVDFVNKEKKKDKE